MDEVWIPIKGYEGRYDVSNMGNVRSHDTVQTRSNGKVVCNFHIIGRGVKIMPAWTTRLCKVGEKLGYFHTWEHYSKPLPASPLIGGEPQGFSVKYLEL